MSERLATLHLIKKNICYFSMAFEESVGTKPVNDRYI